MKSRSILHVAMTLAVCAGVITAHAQTPAQPRTINITMTDPVDGKMSYSLSRITAQPGEQLRIRLFSASAQPKTVMAHNWLLLRPGVDPTSFAEDAATARDTDFIPVKRKAQVVASSGLLGPGEREDITFTVPKVIGKYTYLCTFPGHFAAGMVGELLVK